MSWLSDAHREWHTVNGPVGKVVCPLDCYDFGADYEGDTPESLAEETRLIQARELEEDRRVAEYKAHRDEVLLVGWEEKLARANATEDQDLYNEAVAERDDWASTLGYDLDRAAKATAKPRQLELPVTRPSGPPSGYIRCGNHGTPRATGKRFYHASKEDVQACSRLKHRNKFTQDQLDQTADYVEEI